METKDMLYIVTEYAKNGEMFGEFSSEMNVAAAADRKTHKRLCL